MKTFLIGCAAFLSALSVHAQLGKTRAELTAQWGQQKVVRESEGKAGYKGMLVQLEEGRFLQVTFRQERAVMVSYVHADSSLTEQHYTKYLNQNLQGFAPQTRCVVAAKSYLIDPAKNQLVVQTHLHEPGMFPLLGVVMATDPALIRSLSERVSDFCK